MDFSSVNTLWVLLGAAMVFFMQAGFAMVESGLTRAKNAGNIIMKNLIDFCLGTPVFWLVGFGLMFGSDNPIIGSIKGMASEATYGTGMLPEGVPFYAFFIFQTVFCATAATIVSGAMAERTKFSSYCIYSFIISLVVYPISGHWIWGGGFLAQLGFHDFAGSTAVHMVGGVAALVGAKILGPRIGKYRKNGTPRAIPGHNLTLAALGCFILWFCWFGFNGCSTVSMEGEAISLAGKIFVTTNLSAAVAALTTMFFTWLRYKKPDVSMSLNGALAGLVAITAGCDTVSPLSAAIIGGLSGILVVLVVEFIDRVLKIDDPVGAVAVHGACGAFGTLCVGLFSDGTGTATPGLLLGGGASLLGIQALGVVCVIGWVTVTMTISFVAIKKIIGLRVEKEVELEGLDYHEHNLVSSYADFITEDGAGGSVTPSPEKKVVAMSERTLQNEDEITKISIVTRPNLLDELLVALNSINITGVTITKVMGCGQQKGQKNYYRGAEMEMRLLPKVKLEIVVGNVPASLVIETAESVLQTGEYGDGKIFVYDVQNVVKVRTGETGKAALIDADAS